MNYENLSLKDYLSNKIKLEEKKEFSEVKSQIADYQKQIPYLDKAGRKKIIQQIESLEDKIYNGSRETIKYFQHFYPRSLEIIYDDYKLFFKEWIKYVINKDNLIEKQFILFSLYIREIQNLCNYNQDFKNTLEIFEKSRRDKFNPTEKMILIYPLDSFFRMPRLVLASLKANKKEFDALLTKTEKDAARGRKFNHQLSNYNKKKYKSIWIKFEQLLKNNPNASLRQAVFLVGDYQDDNEAKKYYKSFHKFCIKDHNINSLQQFNNFISTYRQ